MQTVPGHRVFIQSCISITALRDKISVFRNHIREEELLSKSLKGGSLNLLPDHLDIDVGCSLSNDASKAACRSIRTTSTVPPSRRHRRTSTRMTRRSSPFVLHHLRS